MNCASGTNETTGKPTLTCTNPRLRGNLTFANQFISSAFRLGGSVVLVIKPNGDGNFIKLISVNATTMVVNTRSTLSYNYSSYSDDSCTAQSHDVHLDGTTALFAYIGRCRQSGAYTKRIAVVKMATDAENNVSFFESRIVNDLQDLCPQ